MMKRRAAETLMEIVVAMTLFGIIMSGVFEFMANQAQAISKRHEHRILMNGVQKFVNSGKWGESRDVSLGVTFKYDGTKNKERIVVVDNDSSTNLMELYIDPPR